MNSIIRELYLGELYPAQQLRPREKEYKTLREKFCIERDYLMQKLSQEDIIRFEKMNDLYVSANDFEFSTNFGYGLKLGLLLAKELLETGETD